MIPRNLLRPLTLLLFICSLFVSTTAQIRLGYCDEEPTISSLGHTSTMATISCAMGLSKAKQATYTDLSLSHIRVAIMEPECLTSLKVWIRESLNDTTSLACADIDPSTLTKGWNSLALNHSIALDATKILYCGFSYTQSNRLSLAISGKKGQTNAFWIAADENWQDYSKKYAPICIQAELTSPYSHAITLSDCQLEQAYINPATVNPQLELQFEVSNRGMEPLHSFQLAYQMPGTEQIVCPISIADVPLQFGQKVTHRLRLPVPNELEGPDQQLYISILSPNNTDNEVTGQTSDSLWFEIGEIQPSDPFEPLLIEEFTSLDNGYAPVGQARLQEALTLCQRPALIISRHEGYGPADYLAPNNSDYSAQFFGADALTFAPAIWIDREQQPISSTLPADSLADIIAAVNHPRYAYINFDSIHYDAERHQIEAYVDATLQCITAFKNPTLIVCFTQNNLSTPEQKNYYPERYNSSSQSNVLRAFATLPAGGSLLAGADLEAVAHGRVPVGQYKKQQFKAVFSLPSNLSFSADEWQLVAYISDRGQTHQLLGIQSTSRDIH